MAADTLESARDTMTDETVEETTPPVRLAHFECDRRIEFAAKREKQKLFTWADFSLLPSKPSVGRCSTGRGECRAMPTKTESGQELSTEDEAFAKQTYIHASAYIWSAEDRNDYDWWQAHFFEPRLRETPLTCSTSTWSPSSMSQIRESIWGF